MEEEVLKSLSNIRLKTLALVLFLKRNNRVFKRDIDIIANKKRRLRRIIPTIPALLGSAGAILGSGADDDDDPAFLIGGPPIPPIGGVGDDIDAIPGKVDTKPDPVPDPQPVPVDVPQPIPVDVPQLVPDKVPDPIPVDVPQPIPVPDKVPDIINVPGKVPVPDVAPVPDKTPDRVPNPGGIVNWPEIPLIPGLYPEGEDLGQGLGKDIFNPNALPTPSFAFSEGMNINWDTFLNTETIEELNVNVDKYSWVDDLSPLQAWKILNFNMNKPYTWLLLAGLGIAMASLLFPGDAGALAIFGTTAVLAKIKYAIAAGIFLVPPLLNSSAKADELSSINTSSHLISSASVVPTGLDTHTDNTRTVIIITDTPVA